MLTIPGASITGWDACHRQCNTVINPKRWARFAFGKRFGRWPVPNPSVAPLQYSTRHVPNDMLHPVRCHHLHIRAFQIELRNSIKRE